MTDSVAKDNADELMREVFIDGWLRGFDAARRELADAGGTLEAPTFGCIKDSLTAERRARERIRRRKYPKLKAVQKRARP